MTEFVEIGHPEDTRRIAVERREGAGPPIVWLGGFRSDMRGTKAEALDDLARESGRAFVRFDYSGHGESEGRFEDGTISRWTEEALGVLDRFTREPPVLVGSSMGGWIALLATRRLREVAPERAPAGIVLIAPAPDFTDRLMWPRFPEEIRRRILEEGACAIPSAYDPAGYVITRRLIEDGRARAILNGPIETGCPVHILQGMRDEDVPYSHALALVEHLPADGVLLTLIKDGDHRLSRDEDLARLRAAVSAMADRRV